LVEDNIKDLSTSISSRTTTAILIIRFHIPDEHRNPQVQLNYFARALIGDELWLYSEFEQPEI
jgi:hypothetical protein